MNLHTALTTHAIPLWFLILSLFLPRLCIFVAWLQHNMPHYIPATVGIIPVIIWLLVPRILILFWIYQDQGVGLWFLLHAIALVIAWSGGGTTYFRRRHYVEVTD